MRIGMHVGLGGGIETSIRSAAQIGCETIQIFAANPNAWKSSAVTPERAETFRRTIDECDIHPVVIHTPYLLNLASPDDAIYSKSILALADSMHRSEVFGAAFVVTHIGSHRGTGFENGRTHIHEAVSKVLDGFEGPGVLLLENSAGAGDSIGSSFQELGCLMRDLERYEDRIGICLDTAHLWGAGHDLSSPESIDRVISEFDELVGLGKLRVLHLNDTKVELGSKRDRHANVGTGYIGESGFGFIVNHPRLTSLPGIIETPGREQGEVHDVAILKGLRIDRS
jgi:deoxyribonuclease-4